MFLLDQHFDQPVIKVVAASPRLEALQARLRQAGFRPVPANLQIDANVAEPMLVDLCTTAPSQLNDLIAKAPEHQLVLLGDLPPDLDTQHILHLRSVDQIPTLLARLSIRQREVRRKQEYTLRHRAAQELGLPEKATLPKRKQRILFLGDSSQKFTALSHDLKSVNIDVVAALTVLTAQDYLSTGDFDAILLHPRTPGDEANKFLERAAIPTHATPANIYILEEPGSHEILSCTSLDQATRLINASQPTSEIASLINRQLEGQSKAQFHAASKDIGTPSVPSRIFSLDYLKTYLSIQFDEVDKLGERLTLVYLDAGTTPELSKAAATILTHLRDTDLAARTSDSSVAIVLPATNYRGGVTLARRIEAALPNPVTTRVVERRQYHTVLSLLAALTGRPSRKIFSHRQVC